MCIRDRKIGDVIGSSEAAMSAPVHSSISGTVTAITDVLHISCRNMQSVVIENDGLEQISDSVCPPTVENLSLIHICLYSHDEPVIAISGGMNDDDADKVISEYGSASGGSIIADSIDLSLIHI